MRHSPATQPAQKAKAKHAQLLAPSMCHSPQLQPTQAPLATFSCTPPFRCPIERQHAAPLGGDAWPRGGVQSADGGRGAPGAHQRCARAEGHMRGACIGNFPGTCSVGRNIWGCSTSFMILAWQLAPLPAAPYPRVPDPALHCGLHLGTSGLSKHGAHMSMCPPSEPKQQLSRASQSMPNSLPHVPQPSRPTNASASTSHHFAPCPATRPAPQYGNTPLHLAATDGHVEVCTELVAAGAPLEHRNKVRMWACGVDRREGGGTKALPRRTAA